MRRLGLLLLVVLVACATSRPRVFTSAASSSRPLTFEGGNDATNFLPCAQAALVPDLFHEKTDVAFMNLATRPDNALEAVILGHGNAGFICTGEANNCKVANQDVLGLWNVADWNQLPSAIDRKFASLRLWGCAVGADSDGANLLYQIAKRIHVPVFAPTSLIWCYGGQVYPDKGSQWQMADDSGVPRPKKRPTKTFPPPTLYKIKGDARWDSYASENVIPTTFLFAPDPIPNGYEKLDAAHAVEFARRIDFEHPFETSAIPAAVITAEVTITVRTEAGYIQRTFSILSDIIAQDKDHPDVFYNVDSRLEIGLRDLRRR